MKTSSVITLFLGFFSIGYMAFGYSKSSGKVISIECEVEGMKESSQKFQTIVKGTFKVNEDTLNKVASHPKMVNFIKKGGHNEDDGYFPVGYRSQVFGSPEGTRLQIYALTSIPPHRVKNYFYYDLLVNNIRIRLPITNNKFGLRLATSNQLPSPPPNNDFVGEFLEEYPSKIPAPAPLQPIVLPEGHFLKVWSKCSINKK